MKFSHTPFEFDSDFDSGNLENVVVEEKTHKSMGDSSTTLGSTTSLNEHKIRTDYHIKLWTKPDGTDAGTPTKNRTWFHFRFEYRPVDKDQPITVMFQFMNLNRVQKLFQMGTRPVYRHESTDKWRRISVQPITNYVNGSMEMCFTMTFGSTQNDTSGLGTRSNPAPCGMYHFAYCLPYSYGQLQDYLKELEQRLFEAKIPETRIPQPLRLLSKLQENGFYYHRDVLIKTKGGLYVDILTVTSFDGILGNVEQPPPHTFPLATPRSKRFDLTSSKKSIFVITARVHPAETIASYMLDGFIDFITSSDPKAQFLRSKFVFKIIPMLNPDGVFRGHYRGDIHGVNLNRVYVEPSIEEFPTIWATKTYIEYLHKIGTVSWYFDFHGHANKPGSFLFGNWIPDVKKQYEMLSFARFCYLNNPLFDYSECDFTPKGMLPNEQNGNTVLIAGPPKTVEQTKDGTSRVSIYKLTNAHHCYTFEANYYGVKNDRRTLHFDPYIPKKPVLDDKRFSLADMRAMGRSIALSVFDMENRSDSHVKTKMNSNGVSLHDWVVERLRRMYLKANVPLSEQALQSTICTK